MLQLLSFSSNASKQPSDFIPFLSGLVARFKLLSDLANFNAANGILYGGKRDGISKE